MTLETRDLGDKETMAAFSILCVDDEPNILDGIRRNPDYLAVQGSVSREDPVIGGHAGGNHCARKRGDGKGADAAGR